MKDTIASLLEIAEKYKADSDDYARGIGAGMRIAAEAMQRKLDTEAVNA